MTNTPNTPKPPVRPNRAGVRMPAESYFLVEYRLGAPLPPFVQLANRFTAFDTAVKYAHWAAKNKQNNKRYGVVAITDSRNNVLYRIVVCPDDVA